MTKTCAIIGCSPSCFPWGFDEEDEGCAALKLILMNRISKLIGEGYTQFAVSMDCGVGLYTMEIIQGLKESNEVLETICHVPYEEQASKWTPELRERYFNALAASTKVINVAHRKTVGCQFRAHLETMTCADTMLVICNPDDPNCEREISVIAVAEKLGKRILQVDPKCIQLH